MHRLSVLLGLTGSDKSQYAAEVAWLLGKRVNGRVVASHVVDTRMAWELLRNDRPGYLGSGVYIEAFEELSQSLTRIGQALAEKFEAVAAGQSVPTQTIVEQGSPVQRLSERAKDHDIVIIGHQPRDPRSKEQEHCNFIRYAVAEGLVHECPRPLLVVQDKIYNWSDVSILVSVDHLNFDFMRAGIQFADGIGLTPNLVILASGVHEEKPLEILQDLRKAHPELNGIDVSIRTLRGLSVDRNMDALSSVEIELDWTPPPETLLLLPTRKTGGSRITIFDTSPDAFVRNLALPAIMMWPEEYTDIQVNGLSKKADALSPR